MTSTQRSFISSPFEIKTPAAASAAQDLILTVHGDAKKPELTPLGSRVIEALGLQNQIVNLENGTVRLVRVTGDATQLPAQLQGVRRIALVHLGKNPLAQHEQDVKKQAEGIFKTAMSQQFDADIDEANNGLLEYRLSLRNKIISTFEALQKDSKKETRNILVEDLDSTELGQIAADALTYASWQFRLPDQDAAEAIKKQKKPATDAAAAAEEEEDESKIKVAVQLVSSALREQGDAKAQTAGIVSGEAQNFCRYLAELPSNYMTPTIFCDVVKEKFAADGLGDKVKVAAYDEKWAREKGMNLFLSVAQGSDEPPRFLELEYRGAASQAEAPIDIILVGKGVTFDSGGISLKPAEGMKAMRGDMGGAAAVVGALYAVARLGLPINMNVITVLTENMPSGKATKPGDVYRAMNQKSVEIDNTDAEGRLILADALCYASDKKPKMLVDVATLTGACVIALGHVTAACFSNTRHAWKLVEQAGVRTNDYFWRMPLFIDEYKPQLKSHLADLNNIGGRPAGSCTAAAFLSQFVDFEQVPHWAHLDIAGVSDKSNHMTGRPVRALVELAKLVVEQKQSTKQE